MVDQNSAFNIQNSLQRVNESLSISPKYDDDETLSIVDKEFRKRFVSNGQTIDTSDGSVVQVIEKCARDLLESAVSVASMTFNQLNFNYAQGSFLDTIASLFRLSRRYKTPTRVKCRFWGLNNTVVPAGKMVADDSGHTFMVEHTVSITTPSNESGVQNPPSDYYGDGVVVCNEGGDISVGVNSVTTISTGVLGWESVDNDEAGYGGRDDESDASFRARVRKCRYCGNAMVESVRSRVMSVDGVKECLVVENGTGRTIYVNDDGTTYESSSRPQGNTDPAVLPHSLLVIVDGGSEEDVARSIFDTVAVGTNLTPLYTTSGTEAASGDVLVPDNAATVVAKYVRNVTVTDEAYGLRHTVTYNLGENLPFKVEITVIRNRFKGATADIVSAVKDAVLAWQNGESPFVDGLSLGQNVYKYEISAAVSDSVPDIVVKNVRLFTKTGGAQPTWNEVAGNRIAVAVFRRAVTTRDTVDVVVRGETN